MPLLGPTTVDRNQVFQKLKPPCVALSQAVLGLSTTRGDVQSVVERLESLQQTLQTNSSSGGCLDEKLADYVFFPLSQVLKSSRTVSVRCLELTLSILATLIRDGWRQTIQPELAAQLLIFCTLLSSRKPTAISSLGSTAELQEEALGCLGRLFHGLTGRTEGRALLTGDRNVPQLGQTISTILDGINDGGNIEVQLAAVNSFKHLILCIDDHEVFASFLPGIVSILTKVLTPSTKQRRNHSILVGCLEILSSLLGLVFADNLSTAKTPSTTRNELWTESAAIEIRSALASVFRLRIHERHDVRIALARLAITVLRVCSTTLDNCSQIALENLIALSIDETDATVKFELDMLIKTKPSVLMSLESILHDWLQSMPRIMQSADDPAKIKRIQLIGIVYGYLTDAGADVDMIDVLLAQTLQDSVVICLRESPEKLNPVSDLSSSQSVELAINGQMTNSLDFPTILGRDKPAVETIQTIENLLSTIPQPHKLSNLAEYFSRSLNSADSNAQVSSFWLLLTVIKSALHEDSEVDALLDLGDDGSISCRDHLEDLYSFSLSVLTGSSEESSIPQLQSLALRTIALRAQQEGREFRIELIDALYPVVHSLATPDEQLQQDSIVTLNILTQACGYDSVQQMIVDNVDYMTNAVALKLNAFDISPEAPQVLLMMVRLAGPSLLPYLQDTIESIFAALEDYHGYPLLVESLFRVLGVMAEEGVKVPQLTITNAAAVEILQSESTKWHPTDLKTLTGLLHDRRQEESREETFQQGAAGTFPKRPWKEIGDNGGEEPDTEAEVDEEEEDQDAHGVEEVDNSPPAAKTYNLLLKITELTQHFLPSASPSLRTSLLSLVRTTVPAMARHENSFLPLINTLWPEIVSRLDDSEANVQCTALDLIALLCEHAGEFMRSRVMQLWPEIIIIHKRVANDIVGSILPSQTKTKGGKLTGRTVALSGSLLRQALSRPDFDHGNTSARALWAALIRLITTIVQRVPLTPQQFDEALEMVEPMLEANDVKTAFEEENADAVWLGRFRAGTAVLPELPTTPERSRWRFAVPAR